MVGDSIDSTCPSVLNAKNIDVSYRSISDLTGIEVFVNDTVLFCIENQLTFLTSLPSSLKQLYCYNNQLSSLPSLPSSLTYLFCEFNQLSSLPILPNTLIELSCHHNNLTSLPTLPSSLTSLRCYNNQLTTLPSLPNSLTYLNCYYNQITNLPTLPSSLNELVCGDNLLTTLPTLPDSLNTVYCNNNPITCLPDLNNLKTLYFANTLINCLPNYGLVNSGYPPINSLQLCGLFNSNGCEVLWNIEGTSYLDIDSNCIQQNNEHGYSNTKLNLFKNGILDQQTYTNMNGNYDFDTYSNGLYKIEIDTSALPFEVNCPSGGFYLDTISATDSIKYNRDFALKCKGADLAVSSIYAQNLRPASLRTVKIYAGNLSNIYALNCSAGVCGTISITITGACNYYSSPSYALTPTSVVGNVLTYSIADFGAISYDSTFDFNLLIDTTAVVGSQICITVNVYTKCIQEINYSNNQLTQCLTVIGSYDPNDKAVYPTTTLDISGNKWLNYTIRFQNTGTAEAEHIYITDTMSNLVDISTFTLLSYSHQPLMQIYNDGLVKFNFPNIHLPDSNTNEPESHGYVQYKIRAKDSLTVGSTIDNTANIFFDYNAPVITNTTSNLLINCSIPKTILNATICRGEAYVLNGQEYYNSGVYQQDILTAFGCDSVVELRLTVNTINNNITQSAGTLQTSAAVTNYQWINCTTGTAIVGANTQTFNPTQSGSYAVVVDFGTCQDTSACFYFSPVGINEINASNISIQPNPFNNELKVMLDKNYEGVIEIYTTIGALITSEKLQSRNVTLNTSNWNPGVYILKVATNAGVVVKKVVKR
jgi:Leucine-rich repeat (LRR) protein